MAYEGVPFEGVTGGRSFALTADCVNYLERFARDRAVEPRFGVEVTRVERASPPGVSLEAHHHRLLPET